LLICYPKDRLLHVPNAQPPLPSDWEVRPTYPVHTVPYYLAPLWEQGVRHRAEEIAAAKKVAGDKRAGIEEQKGRIPQVLRQKLKKSKGAKSLLQDLEEEVRSFVREYERRLRAEEGEDEPEVDSEDEEIVFVGRNGSMSDEQRKTVEEELEREKLVFDSLADDHGASFGYVVPVYVWVVTDEMQTLACSLYCCLLWTYLEIYHCWRSGETRGLCWHQGDEDWTAPLCC
jgi:hypothetical protein